MVQGYVDPAFAAVADVFERIVRRSRGGASVSVWHRGEPVVDLWGGYKDSDATATERWQADTLAMCFSTTKGVASTALHVCADRGLIDYDDRVAEHWPEFAQNGKENIRVRHIMSHSSGLYGLRHIVDSAEQLFDWDVMVDALARSKPSHAPGVSSGYHAITYGWLVGELVRRVSGKPVDQFVLDEIAGPLDLDGLYIGCPPSERHRIADLEPFAMGFRDNRVNRGAYRQFGKRLGKALHMVGSPINPRRMINALVPKGMGDLFWSEQTKDAVLPAVNGFFTARSLGKVFAALAGGGAVGDARLVGPETIERLNKVQVRGIDRIVVMPMQWRLGYHLVPTSRGIIPGAFGHFGFGGSGSWADPSRNLSVAFVPNRGGGTPMGDSRLVRIGSAAVQSADARAESGVGHSAPIRAVPDSEMA